MKIANIKRRALALLVAVVILVGICSVPIIGAAQTEKEYLDIPGIESYTRIAASMAYRYGIKTAAIAKDEMPFSGLKYTLKLTASAPAEGENHLEISTCRVVTEEGAEGFADGVKLDISAAGKTYNVFGALSPADSEGIRVYVAAEKNDKLYVPKGTVKLQFSVTPTKGNSTSEQYAEYEEGFVFESREFAIGSDGYVYVDYNGVTQLQGATAEKYNFYKDYLPKVNAVNIVITPDEQIEDGDVFYVGGFGVYREKQEYRIHASSSNICGSICGSQAHISASSRVHGELDLLLDGKAIPEYITLSNRTDNFGAACVDVALDADYIGEGYHVITLLCDGEKVYEETLCFDSTPPILAASTVKDGGISPSSGVIDITGADAESFVAEVSATLDNAPITLPYTYSNLKDGIHIIKYTLTDGAGNVSEGNVTFTVGGSGFGGFSTTEGGVSLGISGADSRNATLFWAGEALPVEAYTNLAQLSELPEKTPEGETSAPVSGSELVSRDERYPYIAYDVDVSEYEKETLFLSFTGAANIGETLVLSAYSEKLGCWQELDRARMTGESLSLGSTVTVADYAAEGKIKCRVSILSVDNGSDTFAWTTDGQHAIEHNFEDGSYRDYTFYLEEQNEWFVEEYKNGNISYVINTGDIANDGADESQYAEAREINNILENANIPNGVVPGNHDLDFDKSNKWIYWQKYFGPQYYEGKDWYGGKYDDNNSAHYDLVTVAGRDMIFMCASYSLDTNTDVHEWIIDTLNMYPDRTAVLCVHSYIGTEGELLSDGGKRWWNYVVQKCPTISLVLCGHEPGAASNIRITDDGRAVTEILHDYQSDWYPNWWNWGEGGWGLFRYVTFGDGTVTNRTYTASQEHYDKDYYWDYDLENFTLPMSFIENNRVIKSYGFAAVESEKGSEIASAAVENGAAVFEGELAEGVYYAVCGDMRSGMLSVSGADAVPVLTSAKGYGGRVRLSWEGVADAVGYTVYVNGEEYATLSADKREFVGEAEYGRSDTCTVAVAAVYANGSMAWSQLSEIRFVGTEAFSHGDIDASGAIDVADALAVLRVSVGFADKVTPEQWHAADIDLDGTITVSDALVVLRIAAGLA